MCPGDAHLVHRLSPPDPVRAKVEVLNRTLILRRAEGVRASLCGTTAARTHRQNPEVRGAVGSESAVPRRPGGKLAGAPTSGHLAASQGALEKNRPYRGALPRQPRSHPSSIAQCCPASRPWRFSGFPLPRRTVGASWDFLHCVSVTLRSGWNLSPNIT